MTVARLRTSSAILAPRAASRGSCASRTIATSTNPQIRSSIPFLFYRHLIEPPEPDIPELHHRHGRTFVTVVLQHQGTGLANLVLDTAFPDVLDRHVILHQD